MRQAMEVSTGIILTAGSAASSYGMPVLRIMGHGPDLGPSDDLPIAQMQRHRGCLTAADLVARWGAQPEREPQERAMAAAFCAALPDGPQPALVSRGAAGGRARAAKLSAKRRKAIASKAGSAPKKPRA